MIPDDEQNNFDIFLDCLSATIVASLSPSNKKGQRKRAVKGRKNEIKAVIQDATEKQENDAAELGEFVEYLSTELFLSLPPTLRTLSYALLQESPALATTYSTPLSPDTLSTITSSLPPSTTDSLSSYSIIPSPSHLDKFLEPMFTSYINAASAPPPEYTPALTASRPSGCEICGREHVPLTYHHLIPRQIHAKAVKRGWHQDWQLNKVAWLCRACHSFVHKVATNEELAREYYDVELLMGREDVRKFAQWVGRVRWKAR
ncbi:uncharacterized protein LTR77_003004 [Saxophila tyrrhenica]|uniref:Uncharacterized protein n=1 Tax=Saxophila tyrrhenica TaxID=1690608 RepID=A0AAV9PKF8_9PEZI|nr:hypothetical protein LTR77_003004 [Saxophila tyrrhenica]